MHKKDACMGQYMYNFNQIGALQHSNSLQVKSSYKSLTYLCTLGNYIMPNGAVWVFSSGIVMCYGGGGASKKN